MRPRRSLAYLALALVAATASAPHRSEAGDSPLAPVQKVAPHAGVSCPQLGTGSFKAPRVGARDSTSLWVQLRCEASAYDGDRLSWCHHGKHGGMCGDALLPSISDVETFLMWPEGAPIRAQFGDRVPVAARLSVYRWLKTGPVRVRQIVLDQSASWSWSSDLLAGRYLLVVQATRGIPGDLDVVEYAFPVEFLVNGPGSRSDDAG